MTSPVTRLSLAIVNLLRNVEQAYRNTSETKGVPVDSLFMDVRVFHVPDPGAKSARNCSASGSPGRKEGVKPWLEI